MPAADKFLWIDAMVPNMRGAGSALNAGVHKITITVSASAAHSLANVCKTREEMIEEVRAIVRLRDDIASDVRIEAGVSTAFGCTIQGVLSDEDVVWTASEYVTADVDEASLSDATGMANPEQVRRLLNKVRAAIGNKTGATHMRNTWGLGLAI